MITVRVTIFVKPGVLDAQGQAVASGLRTLGFEVGEVRVGRAIDVTLPTDGWQRSIERACERFLANPLTEEYEIVPVRAPMHDGSVPQRAETKG
ncbi:MAG: phosphoribosylformylglycinamidine synthase subunit PurS [Armatimonadota bacterium]|nr:phosphoribosylformylglycinamidine synthase subunit PurS [Armatimonadota bacterium]MDR5697838.1 phosphoribosylformylglycinamidine synthase subunit PurS [Armatimonadota bacterium]